MLSRIKKKCITGGVTTEQAEEAGKLLVEKQNRLEQVEAKMNEEVNEVKSRYSGEITLLKEQLKEPTDLLEVYANEQKGSWGKKKSIQLLYVEVGFRTGTPKLFKQKNFTWEAVLELLKKNKVFQPFIRIKEEINKEAILSLNTTNKKDQQRLQQLKEQCFLYIDQEPCFYIKPRKEAV